MNGVIDRNFDLSRGKIFYGVPRQHLSILKLLAMHQLALLRFVMFLSDFFLRIKPWGEAMELQERI